MNSRYIIDGVQCELTPSDVLGGGAGKSLPGSPLGGEERKPQSGISQECESSIIDETIDPSAGGAVFSVSKTKEYISLLKEFGKASYPLAFSAQHTRAAIAAALVDACWLDGAFLLENLKVDARWQWQEGPVGTQTAFYRSVEAAADYLDSLDLRIDSYSLAEGEPQLKVAASPEDISAIRHLPDRIVPDASSWIIYIPFDTSDYRLGGSLLAAASGNACGGTAPSVDDPDYLMDCFEVVRELSQDGILLSARTVLEGGLATALDAYAAACGADVNVSDLPAALESDDLVRLLFAEVPGALIQIADDDFDYVDAELLLQDVMYFPLGHPAPGKPGLRIATDKRKGIEGILASLMR
ncbi:MAG: hypothetical protein KBS55_06395 [Bacteroidales bacterium]|nr:hypothetical protein [Candidatus Cryptobacteroides aphodequi]